jgi:Rieske Fe-S protein
MTTPLTRRSLLTGFVTAVVGGIAGFAVARNSDAAKASSAGTTPTGYGPSPQPSAGATTPGKLLTAVADVPRGGGTVIGDVVLSRDTDGTLHAFSSICTHQSCPVGAPANGAIVCPCHGSKFNADTGAVVNGPATRPLPKISIKVKGGNVYQV